MFSPIEFTMDLRGQGINWLWVGEFSEDEGFVGDSPRRVAGGCCGCVGLGVCKLLTGNFLCVLVTKGGLSKVGER